ncbi:MAG: hypothetical protein JW822_11365 [Spirochaetales bacterium]|nr:hypothetical protein [Spirochaetales bacterium]
MASRDIRRLKQKKEEEKKDKGKMATSTFSMIIIGIIIIGFLLSFFPGAFIPSTKISFGSYAGKEILWEYDNYFSRTVNSEFNNREESLKQQLLEAETPEDKEKIQKKLSELTIYSVIQNSFDGIVFHIASLLEAERSGLRVSNKRIQEIIAQFFKSELLKYEDKKQRDKKFLDLYTNHEDYFRELLLELQYKYDRRGLLMQPSLEAFQRQYSWDFSNLLSSPKEIEFAAEIARVYRKFNFFLLDYEDYPLDALLDYVNSDPQKKDLFRTLDLSRIIFNGGKSEVEELRSKIISGRQSFEEKADKVRQEDEYAEEVIEQYTYYYYELIDIVKDEAEKVVSLKTGELSQPLQIDEEGNTWIIYRCEKEMSEPDFTTPKMQQALMDYMKFKEMKIIQDYFEAKAVEFKQKAAAVGFKAACAQMGITYYTTDFFPLNFESLNYINAPVSAQENINELIAPAIKSEEFFIKAFSLETNAVADPILLDKHIMVLHLAEERKISEEELETLKTTYVNYKSFTAFSDLQTLLVKDKKLENKVQQGIEAHKKLMESLSR